MQDLSHQAHIGVSAAYMQDTESVVCDFFTNAARHCFSCKWYQCTIFCLPVWLCFVLITSRWLCRDVQREQALAEKRNPQPPRVVALLPLSQVSFSSSFVMCTSASSPNCSKQPSVTIHSQLLQRMLVFQAHILCGSPLTSPACHYQSCKLRCQSEFTKLSQLLVMNA